MSFESWELYREAQTENFRRHLRAMQSQYEARLAQATSDAERQTVLEGHRKDLDNALRDSLHATAWGPAYGMLASALVGLALWLIVKSPVAWEYLPQVFLNPFAVLLVAPATAFVGWLFFMLRKEYRFIYSSLELAIACATSCQSAVSLAHASAPDRWAYILALMASIYIAVRAFDNFDKWRHPEIDLLRRLVTQALAASESAISERAKT